MVHKLRVRNICNSTPTTNERIQFNLQNARMLLEAGKSGEQQITPVTANIAVNDAHRILNSTFILPDISVNIQNNNVNLDAEAAELSAIHEEHFPNDVNISTIIDSNIENCQNMCTEEIPDRFQERSSKNRSLSYYNNITTAIDKVIFEKTYKRRGGISLHAVRQSLSETYGYKYNRFRKISAKYISASIASGHFRQTSGHGLLGKFRLNTTKHTILKRRYKKKKPSTVAKCNATHIVIQPKALFGHDLFC